MGAGIMGTPRSTTVDVRDMLCAQALAIVAQALRQLKVGEALRIIYNAEDVKGDLIVWAHEQGHGVHETGTSALRIERQGAAIV